MQLLEIKEVLPELGETIYAFDRDDYAETPPQQENPVIQIPVIAENNVDLYNLTDEQKADCLEAMELFKANPKLAEDKVCEIRTLFENGAQRQEVINREYASIVVLMRSAKKWAEIGGYFDEKG